MISFPLINNEILLSCFDRITALYVNDKRKVLDAAVKATVGEPSPFVITLSSVDEQILQVRARVKRTADRYGQNLLLKLIEELLEDLSANGAIGVSNTDFISSTKITLQGQGVINYSISKKWVISWDLIVDENSREILIGLRDRSITPSIIVPDYILQYIQQGIAAFQSNRFAVSLALMTIALEGTLRDALAHKGYTYVFGTPAEDVYELKEMHIHKETGGYKVTFPNTMPSDHSVYLSLPGDPSHKSVRIKRILKGGNTYLEIRDANDLLDYWSSDTVVQAGAMRIGGLGAAIDIGRNHANILTPADLPPDLDNVIKAVRNNLIHLSGSALNENVATDNTGHSITLNAFIKSKNRVFDAVCTIGDTINEMYTRLANGTL
jgi:hypothetical protein